MTAHPMPTLTFVPTPEPGPEDVVCAEDGTAYTALRDAGIVVRVPPGAEAGEAVARMDGQCLGTEMLGDGRLLVCNAPHGLRVVDPESGTVTAHTEAVGGRPFGVCNNAHVARDGAVYVSESSTAHPLDQFRRDIVEDTRSGALWRVPPDGEPERLLDGLSFANGVALHPDERFVLVAETAKCRVHRVWLTGERAGEDEVFAETDGFPDNISVGRAPDGRAVFWIALPAPRVPATDSIHALPRVLRALIARLPEALGPKAERCCRVAAYDEEGQMIAQFDGDPGAYHHVTGVRQHGSSVWLASFEEAGLARFDLPDGWASPFAGSGPESGPTSGTGSGRGSALGSGA